MQKICAIFVLCLVALYGKSALLTLSPVADEYAVWPTEGALRWRVDTDESAVVDADVCVYYYDNGKPFSKYWQPLRSSERTSLSVPAVVQGYSNGNYYEIPVKSVGSPNIAVTTSPFRSLVSVEIEEGVERIGNAIFQNCDKLTMVKLPLTLNSVGSSSFINCSSLNSLLLPDAVKEIGASAFYSCTNIVEVAIPESVETVGDYAFAYCRRLTKLALPDRDDTSWGPGVFRYCDALESVDIAGEITTMPEGMFANCGSLSAVAFSQLHPPENFASGFSANYSGRFYYPSDYAEEWREALGQLAQYGKSWAELDENDPGCIEIDDVKVPYSWLGKYHLTASGSSPLLAMGAFTGKKDSLGRSLTAMDDYIAGTDPTDVNSRFMVKIAMSGCVPSISYEPDLNTNGAMRVYTIYGKANLTDDWTSPTNATHRFFMVEVAMP